MARTVPCRPSGPSGEAVLAWIAEGPTRTVSTAGSPTEATHGIGDGARPEEVPPDLPTTPSVSTLQRSASPASTTATWPDRLRPARRHPRTDGTSDHGRRNPMRTPAVGQRCSDLSGWRSRHNAVQEVDGVLYSPLDRRELGEVEPPCAAVRAVIEISEQGQDVLDVPVNKLFEVDVVDTASF